MINCFFCKEPIVCANELGQEYHEPHCTQHTYKGTKLWISHHRRVIFGKTMSILDELEWVEFMIPYPLEDEKSMEAVRCFWDLQRNVFTMDIEIPMGEYYDYRQLMRLDYLPDFVNPENAYDIALRTMKVKAFL